MTTIDIQLQNAEAMLAQALAAQAQLQAEEERLTQVRKELLTTQSQAKNAAAAVKEANEQAARLFIERQNQAIVVQHAQQEAEAERIAAAARQKTAQADCAAELVNSIQTSAKAADEALAAYTAQLVKVSQAKRQIAALLAQEFEVPGHAAPSPTVAQEIQAGKQVLEALDRQNNALNDAAPVAVTQAKAADYASLTHTLIAPYVTK
jgi:hypothetical protein